MDKASFTHPVDTGWAWVVLCSSFYVSFIAEGFLFAIPVYFVEFLEVFHENASTTAWIASLNGGIFCAVGRYAFPPLLPSSLSLAPFLHPSSFHLSTSLHGFLRHNPNGPFRNLAILTCLTVGPLV